MGVLAVPTIISAPVPAAILISSTPSPKRMACWALAHVSICLALVADWRRAKVNRLFRVEAAMRRTVQIYTVAL